MLQRLVRFAISAIIAVVMTMAALPAAARNCSEVDPEGNNAMNLQPEQGMVPITLPVGFGLDTFGANGNHEVCYVDVPIQVHAHVLQDGCVAPKVTQHPCGNLAYYKLPANWPDKCYRMQPQQAQGAAPQTQPQAATPQVIQLQPQVTVNIPQTAMQAAGAGEAKCVKYDGKTGACKRHEGEKGGFCSSGKCKVAVGAAVVTGVTLAVLGATGHLGNGDDHHHQLNNPGFNLNGQPLQTQYGGYCQNNRCGALFVPPPGTSIPGPPSTATSTNSGYTTRYGGYSGGSYSTGYSGNTGYTGGGVTTY